MGLVIKARRISLPFIFLLVCGVVASCQGSAYAQQASQTLLQNREKAKGLWEQAIAAKGGRERLFQVNSLLISYQETVRNILEIVVHQGPVEKLFVFPSKVWSWDDGLPPPFSLTVGVLDLERDYACRVYAESKSPVCGKARQLGSREGIDEAQYLYLMETRWIQPTPVSARKDSIGFKTIDVVVTQLEDKRIEYYLSRETHLPQRVVTFRGAFHGVSYRARSSYDFSDYMIVNGIQMPGKQKRGRINFSINPAYDDGIFSRPPSIKAGLKAWQPRK